MLEISTSTGHLQLTMWRGENFCSFFVHVNSTLSKLPPSQFTDFTFVRTISKSKHVGSMSLMFGLTPCYTTQRVLCEYFESEMCSSNINHETQRGKQNPQARTQNVKSKMEGKKRKCAATKLKASPKRVFETIIFKCLSTYFCTRTVMPFLKKKKNKKQLHSKQQCF